MQIGIDYYEWPHNSGCCLRCDEAEPGCLCYDCKCKRCCWYQSHGDGTGHCGLVSEWQAEAEDRWQDVIDNMREQGRKLVYCPKCDKRRFMFQFPNDVICEYWCQGCQTAWKKEHFELFETDQTFRKQIIAMRKSKNVKTTKKVTK